ncbi:protein TRC8 homolog isoform X2 [Toxorhynchites rutilus septentrionalis]|uniref:protein TRC8 homolog isoform X2 n=1 Tax=Toxorhynchites rutilus septentrionalis TaxID=329112 RepID=UPI0024790704|nr:protein TRC8 homolog isoform X2 [Toxorhynchites rutilus septentrionalis]
MSVVRTKVLGLVDVIMRVPSLFIIDEILKISMGLPNSSLSSSSTSGIGGSATAPTNVAINTSTVAAGAATIAGMSPEDVLREEFEFYKFVSLTTLKFLLCLFGCISAACVFMLWTRHLVIVYMYIISVGLIFLSYWSNVSAISLISDGPSLLEDILSLNMERLLDPGGVALSILPHLLAQWLMGVIFAYIHLGPKYKLIQKALPFSFLMPLFLAMLPLPTVVLKHSPAFAALLPLALSKIALWSSSFNVVKTILNGYQHARNFASNFGISALIENEWQRLNVPCVLRAFWSIRLTEQLISLLMTSDVPLRFAATVQSLLVSGCETLTAVLGMTSIISLICHYIGKAFQLFLMSEDYDEDKSIGTVSAILFYILALQTGLTSLTPDKRFVRLCRNLCLLITALLHFLHNIVAPILMSLSAARNPSRKRHARALMVCAFLMITPIGLLSILWSRHTPSTWLLAVTAFSVEVIVKVLVSLATYTLFLLDARRQTFWEKLDDYVYYIRAFGNSVEFCFGIFLLFNGAWILIFESGGAIRALMMCIHAYFNIWCEARAGWGVFMKRRTAVHKISSLPEATPLQLRSFDDVCAICYQEMTSAKITRCKHYFHGVCLRKWLYVQDRCPLCHEIIMNPDSKSNEGSGDEGNDDINGQNPNPNPAPNPVGAADNTTHAHSASSSRGASTPSNTPASSNTSSSGGVGSSNSSTITTSSISNHSLIASGFRIPNPSSASSSTTSLPVYPSSSSGGLGQGSSPFATPSNSAAVSAAAVSQIIRQQHQPRSSVDRDFLDELE